MAEARVIDGKAFAEGLRARIGEQAAALKVAHGITPGLAAVLVGDDPASQIYVRSKGRATEAAGMNSFTELLPGATSQDALLDKVAALNADPAVNGILVQLPLPDHIDPEAVIDQITPAKDVDGFHPINIGALVRGRDALVACTPLGCMMLLRHVEKDLSGKSAVVVGRSNIVGKPMALLLLAANCTVTVAHSLTRDLPAVCRDADVLVAAVGQPELIRGDWIKPGAIVIDVGISRVPAAEEGKTRLVGDVAYDEAAHVAGAITPVPGGVGPMTIACLLQNTLTAACRQYGVAEPPLLA